MSFNEDYSDLSCDVLVVGAGPAGLFAAIAAAGGGATVLLCEKRSTPARKLLASGSGQCNLSHYGPVADFLSHYGSSSKINAAKFLRPSLYGFNDTDLAGFLAERGLVLETTEGGKLFPSSRRARDFLDLLLTETRRLDVVLRTDCRIGAVRRDDGRFALYKPDAAAPTARGRTLILTTGGASWPATGSEGDGYALASEIGHRIVAIGPALTPVVIDPSSYAPFVACSGLALRACPVGVYRGEKKIASGVGDVLFTHRGLSGPGILDLSRSIRVGDSLRLPLATPTAGSAMAGSAAADTADIEARFLSELDSGGKRGLVRQLAAFGLAETLARSLLAALGADPDTRAARLTREARRAIVRALAADVGYAFPVAALGGWEEAMATRGGVALDEVDPRTMASRLVPGLFFAGEILDYDGDTGGYNIHAALATGRLAGASAAGLVKRVASD